MILTGFVPIVGVNTVSENHVDYDTFKQIRAFFRTFHNEMGSKA